MPPVSFSIPSILVLLHGLLSKQVLVYLLNDSSGEIDMYACMGGHDRTTYAFMISN